MKDAAFGAVSAFATTAVIGGMLSGLPAPESVTLPVEPPTITVNGSEECSPPWERVGPVRRGFLILYASPGMRPIPVFATAAQVRAAFDTPEAGDRAVDALREHGAGTSQVTCRWGPMDR